MSSSSESSSASTALSVTYPLPKVDIDESVDITLEVERLKLSAKEMVYDKLWVCKKINEGGFGAIYEVKLSDEHKEHYALKLSLRKSDEMRKLVKMESGILRHLSRISPAFPRFYHYGKVNDFPYLVMDLLGHSLGDLMTYMPEEKFSVGTTLRIGLQLTDAIEAMHSYHFIHRDIKPSNMAIGLKDPRQIYLFDFGLARRFVKKDPVTNEVDLRTERPKAPFRGTYHYCSIQQQNRRDACRRDDMWGLMYSLIELVSGSLPWDNEKGKSKVKKKKEETSMEVLLQNCPMLFEALLKHLDRLDFYSRPSYDFFRETFRYLMDKCDTKESDQFDWEIHPIKPNANDDETSSSSIISSSPPGSGNHVTKYTSSSNVGDSGSDITSGSTASESPSSGDDSDGDNDGDNDDYNDGDNGEASDDVNDDVNDDANDDVNDDANDDVNDDANDDVNDDVNDGANDSANDDDSSKKESLPDNEKKESLHDSETYSSEISHTSKARSAATSKSSLPSSIFTDFTSGDSSTGSVKHDSTKI